MQTTKCIQSNPKPSRMPRMLAILAVIVLMAHTGKVEAADPGSAAPPRNQDLKGVIVSYNAAAGELSVRHRPTEYVMKLRGADKARISIWRQVDLDELPENQPFGGWGRIDEKNKVFNSGIFHVQADSPTLTLGIKGNSVTGRLQRRPASEPAKSLTSRDGKSELLMFDGQSVWTLPGSHGRRPGVFRSDPGTTAEFQPGREIELQYRSDNSATGGELQSAKVSILFPGGPPYYMNTPAGPSKVTVAQIEQQVIEVVKTHAAKADELAKLMPVRMELTPELAKANEPITLRIRALASKTPSAKLEFYPNYLKTARADKKELALAWRATGEKQAGLDVYTAELKLPDAGLGQHLVQWACSKHRWKSGKCAVSTRPSLVTRVMNLALVRQRSPVKPEYAWSVPCASIRIGRTAPGESTTVLARCAPIIRHPMISARPARAAKRVYS